MNIRILSLALVLCFVCSYLVTPSVLGASSEISTVGESRVANTGIPRSINDYAMRNNDTAPCECLPWNQVTVSWTGLQEESLTGTCNQTFTLQEVKCGTSIKVRSSENCSCITQLPVDVYFLADTTCSMAPALSNVSTNASSLIGTLHASYPNVAFGVGQYQDFEAAYSNVCFTDLLSPSSYDINYPDQNSDDAAQKLEQDLIAGPCGTVQECQLSALYELAKNPAYWRPGAKRVIVWIGDNPGHDSIPDPFGGPPITLSTLISELNSSGSGITVHAISVKTGFGCNCGLDGEWPCASGGCTLIGSYIGQASSIAIGTGGKFLSDVPPDNLYPTIEDLIKNHIVENTIEVSAYYDFVPDKAAIYPVTLSVSCNEGTFCPTCTVYIDVKKILYPVADAGPDQIICPGSSVKIGNDQQLDLIYNWTPQQGLDNPNINYPLASPAVTTTYTLTVKDPDDNSCMSSDNVTVTVRSMPTIKVDPGIITVCENTTNFTIKLNATVEPPSPDIVYTWRHPTAGVLYEGKDEPVELVNADLNDLGIYTVTVTDNVTKCNDNATVIVKLSPLPVINNFEVTGSSCQPGETWQLEWDTVNEVPLQAQKPVYCTTITLHCHDQNDTSGADVATYPLYDIDTACGSHSYSYILPSDFSNAGRKCEFCAYAINDCGQVVKRCVPMCDNVSTDGDAVPCSCSGWNPVTVKWGDLPSEIWTGDCGDNMTMSEINCGTVVNVNSSENCTCGLIDVYFLADTTISMANVIAEVQAKSVNIMTYLRNKYSNIVFGVGDYKDLENNQHPYLFQSSVNPYTYSGNANSNLTDAETAISNWSVSGYGNPGEGQLYALYQIANTPNLWRPGAKRIIVWFGDNPGHDPFVDSSGANITQSDVINALKSSPGITVLAISMSTGMDCNYGLDGTQPSPNCTGGAVVNTLQATNITTATQGLLYTNVDSAVIADKIKEIVKNYLAESTIQVEASYEFKPDAVKVYPVTLTASCDNLTCPPCNINIDVKKIIQPEASIIVTKISDCPQRYSLTGKPDNMSYIWKDSGSTIIGTDQSVIIDTTTWQQDHYGVSLYVYDNATGCHDATRTQFPAGYPPCQDNCSCSWLQVGCNPPEKCAEEPCGCITPLNIAQYCYPKPSPSPPCAPVIKNFTATPGPSFGSPCYPNAKWNLSWDVAVPDTLNIAWPAPGDSSHPVYIEFKCTDAGNNVQTYWGPEAFGKTDNITCTLPPDFQPCGKKCEFCLWTYDCKLNKIIKCEPVCENMTVTIPCPDNCECLSSTQAWVPGTDNWKPPCAPCPCGYDTYGPTYCYAKPIGSEPPPTSSPCPANCDCLTEQEALEKGYTTLRSDQPCSETGQPQKFCYSRCPEGCSCITQKEADELGYTVSCGEEKCDPISSEDKYCFSPPLQPCSQSCHCLTQAQAQESGFSPTQRCQAMPCKLDGQGKEMYCYPKPKAPVVDVTADRLFINADEDVKVCWEVKGEGITEVLFSTTGDQPTKVERQGCKTFRPTQQTRYLVTAKSAAGTGQDAVMVGVGQPPVEKVECPTINSFTADCQAAPGTGPAAYPMQGEVIPRQCTINWSVTGPAGTTVSISGIGTVGMSGSTQAKRGATYTLTAKYKDCIRTATTQVQ